MSELLTLHTDIVAPITAEKIGDTIVMREYIKKMTFGPTASRWLYEALAVAPGNYLKNEKKLEHNGTIVLTVLSEMSRIWIIGTNTRFSFRAEFLQELVKWLELNVVLVTLG